MNIFKKHFNTKYGYDLGYKKGYEKGYEKALIEGVNKSFEEFSKMLKIEQEKQEIIFNDIFKTIEQLKSKEKEVEQIVKYEFGKHVYIPQEFFIPKDSTNI